MRLSEKLKLWTDKGIISAEQSQKILEFEQSRKTSLSAKLMYWIAGLFIGIGIILVIGANWDAIPSSAKVAADFALLGTVLYYAYRAVVENKKNSAELFLGLSVLGVGATIGLIAQVFNLQGGWSSFSFGWAVLSVVFVLFSRLKSINMLWLLLLLSSIDFERLSEFLDLMFRDCQVCGMIFGTTFFGLAAYICKELYSAAKKKVVLPAAAADLAIFLMYIVVFCAGISISGILANAFVFVFFAFRLLAAVYYKNIDSFVRNIHLAELYIIWFFISRFDNLMESGAGFILCGIVVLLMLYIWKKSSKYIRKMEIFYE